MKKIILGTIILSFMMMACRKDKTVNPEDKPDAKLIKVLDDYKKELVEAEFGWNARISPSAGGTFSFTFKFDKSDRVNMTADMADGMANSAFESTYRLKATQRPSLFFDTYSYLHLLSDPDASLNGAANNGTGLGSDFEFAFVSASKDSIVLEGNHNKTKMVLVRAKSATDNYVLDARKVLNAFSKLRTYFKRFTLDGVDYDVNVDAYFKSMVFSHFEGTTFKSVGSNFYVDGTDVILKTPVMLGAAEVSKLSGFSFDPLTGISCTAAGKPIQIKEAIAPIKYSLTVAREFYNNPAVQGVVWASNSGFTIDGVSDAFGVKTIPAYNFIVFYPKYNASYDRLGFFVNSAYAAYGPAAATQFLADGKIKFNLFGSFGTAPASIKPIIDATTAKWVDAQGFYVIKINNVTYDLVSAKDARAWIRFSN